MNKRMRECSGCMACKNVCPCKCIQIKVDCTGNFIRLIDSEKCIQCGLCDTVCPSKVLPQMMVPAKAYAARSKKPERRSASGGIATGIYRYCISNNIVCVGVKYDEKLVARYDVVGGIENIDQFGSSKYVCSHMGHIYKKIDSYLQNGKTVVFIGLPCHVAALRNVLRGQNDNLICIDLVCHGVASDKFLLEHIDRMRGVEKNKVGFIEFRDKKNDRGITLQESGTNKTLKAQSKYEDEYMLGYRSGFIYCEQCYRCRYAQETRCSDITIKDFCGNCMTEKLSGVLVNTEKGKAFLDKIEPYFMLYDYPVSQMIAEDAMLRRPTPERKRRKLFLLLYPLLGFDKTIRLLCFHTLLKEKGKKLMHALKY